MQDDEDDARRTWLREGLLFFGFVVLTAVAAWTVALPELSDVPAREPTGSASRDAGPAR